MEIIAQFIENLNTLSANIYNIKTSVEPLFLKKEISENISSLISDPELSQLINYCLEVSSNLSTKLEAIGDVARKEIKKKHYPINQVPYASFIIDDKPPIIKTKVEPHQLSFEELLKNNDIKPVKHRVPIEYTGECPHCGAPNEYIYINVKGGKQYKCKCCTNTFTIHPHYHDEISHHCPYCGHKLLLHHERSNYDVLVCQHQDCPFYLKNKSLVKNGEGEHLRVHKNEYKLHYTFRPFHINFNDIKNEKSYNIKSKVDLSKIHHSDYVLGLILTYYVNYGLSSRKTAQILEEVHDIKVSHQTVVNYAEAAACLMDDFNEEYKYDLTNTLTGDETYIKVQWKTNYVFFFSDTSKKIITSYRIFPNRDTERAIRALYQSFKKYKVLPDNLNIITDGNPIYNAAQVFFKLNDVNFDLYQVIGLANKDKTSKKYRSYKQIEERLNRTYKFNYYGTNGYGSYRGANIYMVLFVSFYNFLRRHSALNNKVPIELDELQNIKLMPHKWLGLLKYSQEYYLKTSFS